MNFFDSQQQARSNTKKLVLLFMLAVFSLIALSNFIFTFALGYASEESFSWSTFDIQSSLWISLSIILVIAVGSLYKVSTLNGGGAEVASMLNGKLIQNDSNDLNERKVLNVVEEMALASGTPVPPVYIIEEDGINAFAAGHSINDAVIGVTRGTVNLLTRDQLQGVVAHEFSHVLHGDMRLNIRLIGILHGILLLALAGQLLARGGAFSGRKNSGGVVVAGLALMIIGYIGVFFGNLIKAAVSRQREFLADASAVRYTRNPDGISGALMAIAQHSEGSKLKNPASSEVSHLLFEEGQSFSLFGSIYATHPPLKERIQAILPNWDGKYPEQTVTETATQESTTQPDNESRKEAVINALLTANILDSIGNPSAENNQQAQKVLSRLPQNLVDAAHNACLARALVYFLLIEQSDQNAHQDQLTFIENNAEAGIYDELQRLLQQPFPKRTDYLPLIQLAASSLRQLSKKQYLLFKKNVLALIEMDQRITLFEWCVQKTVFIGLDSVFERKSHKSLGSDNISKHKVACANLLSALCYVSQQQKGSAEETFNKGAKELPFDISLVTANELDLGRIDESVTRLAKVKPKDKALFIKAMIVAINADDSVTATEVELLRAVAAVLGCPVPLMVAD